MSYLRPVLSQIAASRRWAMVDNGGGNFALEVALNTGRTQVVNLTPANDPDGVEVVFFWSNAAPMNTIRDPWILLRESCNLTHCRYALKDNFIVTITSRISQYLNADELARVIYYVASNADDAERELVGYDAN